MGVVRDGGADRLARSLASTPDKKKRRPSSPPNSPAGEKSTLEGLWALGCLSKSARELASEGQRAYEKQDMFELPGATEV